MPKPEMTGRERLLVAIRHKDPDRVPISPRVGAWLQAEYGDTSLAAHLDKLPDMDPMHIVSEGTPNTLERYPDDYGLPGTGVDVLKTCTPPPVGDFDLAEAKEKIGQKTTIKGYVDLLYVVKRGTPERVEKTVREAMEIAKPGAGFIIGSSDSFREGTPRENIVTYFEACKKYGVYGKSSARTSRV